MLYYHSKFYKGVAGVLISLKCVCVCVGFKLTDVTLNCSLLTQGL